VLFCDLDRFKEVNDTFGHDTGDQVLIVIASRLAEQVRSGDTVARLGGDEFVVLVEDMDGPHVQSLVERIRRSVADPIVVGGETMGVTVSIGIASLRAGTCSVDAVLRDADRAMYTAKAEGHNRFAHAPA
jgi:two-component system, cell cycle response regulator